MFIFAKNIKEIVVTAGAIVACLALLTLAARGVYLGGYMLIVSGLSILLVVAIYRGRKFGYQIGRYLFGISALVAALGTINNPFAYMDSAAEGWSYSQASLAALGYVCRRRYGFVLLSQ